MSKQQDFFEWQDDYVAAEWVQAEATTNPVPSEEAEEEELEPPPTPQAYLSTYHKDLHQRKSLYSLNKITQIVLIFVGLVASTFFLGWLYYQSSWRTASNPQLQKATASSESPDLEETSPQVCAEAGEACDSPTATDLNQLTETINRYREKREEYYNQIEELDQMN